MTEVRRMNPPPAHLDHLIVAATTLADGIEFIAEVTGVVPQPGGKHVAMGTHNALLRLGDRVYLEIIAIDPDGEKPPRPRWFDLDDPAMQAQLAERPRLIHWAARTHDLDAALAATPIPLGTPHPMARGDFRWRITIPDNGVRPAGGVLPTLLQWEGRHPADNLPASGATLAQFAASHPTPDAMRKTLGALGLQDALTVTYGSPPRLAALLRTPRGLVSI